MENLSCFPIVEEPFGLVIFGASGDLTGRKLIPALCQLFTSGLLKKNFFILGVARTKMSDEEFRSRFDCLKEFLQHCYYVSLVYDDSKSYSSLIEKLDFLEKRYGTRKNRIFYLAVPPEVYIHVVENLGKLGLNQERNNFSRIVVEKPFGRDLSSARELEETLQRYFSESQIYRIDHYLGKETVQNVLIFRFGNFIFEEIWNNKFIDHVQITIAEDIGVEHRAGYFESVGLLRDLFQNHMLQMLSIVAMEPPSLMDAESFRTERVKLLKSIRPLSVRNLKDSVVRGQYASGFVNGKVVRAYRDEPGVAKDSNVETFVAMKLFIDNWRWSNVPFYLRAGKRLTKRVAEIAVFFKNVPHSVFPNVPAESVEPNVIVFTLQPDESIALKFNVKRPCPNIALEHLDMRFKYEDYFKVKLPDAYERLLIDIILGDSSLFVRRDDMEVSWQLIDPILKEWQEKPKLYEPHLYPAGSWGPEEANLLIERDGRKWRRP